MAPNEPHLCVIVELFDTPPFTIRYSQIHTPLHQRKHLITSSSRLLQKHFNLFLNLPTLPSVCGYLLPSSRLLISSSKVHRWLASSITNSNSIHALLLTSVTDWLYNQTKLRSWYLNTSPVQLLSSEVVSLGPSESKSVAQYTSPQNTVPWTWRVWTYSCVHISTLLFAVTSFRLLVRLVLLIRHVFFSRLYYGSSPSAFKSSC